MFSLINVLKLFFSQKLEEQFFKVHPPVCDSGLYSADREITGVFNVESGDYVILPSCLVGGSEGEFYLRVFVERDIKKDE